MKSENVMYLNGPQFVDAPRHDYRLKSTSPALKLGFEQIDLSTVGPRSVSACGKSNPN